MKEYIVQISDKALADIEEIYNYIAINLQAPENALNQYNRIADQIEKLNVFPERVKLMATEPEHTMGLRPLIVDNYTAFYYIDDDRVIVTRVLYSASDIDKKLSE